jgi:hypothetical protein
MGIQLETVHPGNRFLHCSKYLAKHKYSERRKREERGEERKGEESERVKKER